MEVQIGGMVSHYKILRKLGSGGMGVVYEAEDTRLGRKVAVKFLTEEMERDPSILERFQREARAASSLNHPGICTVHSIEEHERRHFIVMELLEGQTLAQRMGRQPFEIEELLGLAIQIADALESAHSKGIVHRDLKPVNLMINARGQVKVLDFGLAKIEGVGKMADRESSQADTMLGANQLTTAGTVLGTVYYMSPEQARGQLTDARTDLFSLGAVLYQMATATLPFPGDTQPVVFEAILNRAPKPLSEHNPSMPAALGRVFEKALEKDRNLRYQTATELKTDLLRLKRDLDSGRQKGVTLFD
jgi:serine/threonine protein kinase